MIKMLRALVAPVLAGAFLAGTAPAAAQVSGKIVCDSKVARIAQAMHDAKLNPSEAERAREALVAAIKQCRPLRAGHPQRRTEAPSTDGAAALERRLDLDRQSLRVQQNVLSGAELRDGETRLDAIQRKADSDPAVAREMLRIYEADQSLSTVNRPIPRPEDRR